MKARLLQDIQQLKAGKGYLNAGQPRYNTFIGRDSLIASWQLLDIYPIIAKKTLQVAAKYQAKKCIPGADAKQGKILHEIVNKKCRDILGWPRLYYGSIDSTLWFLIVAAEYLKATGDKVFLLTIWDNLKAAYGWIGNYGDIDGDGYLEYQRTNSHGLFHQGWRDSVKDHLRISPPVAIVEVQGYAYAAYNAFSFLANRLNRCKKTSGEALVNAVFLKARFNKDFWIPKERYYALALDGEKKQRRQICSNSGHLLFTGILSPERVKAVINRLFRKDMWTTYGIRTLSFKDQDFDDSSDHLGSIWPHDNWIIYKGLQKLGFDTEALKIKKALKKAYNALNETLPEYYGATNKGIVKIHSSNPLQAWASAGLLEMIWND